MGEVSFYPETKSWFNDFASCPSAYNLILENHIAFVVYQFFANEEGPANHFVGVYDGRNWFEDLTTQKNNELIHALFVEPSYLNYVQLDTDRPIVFSRLGDPPRNQIVLPTKVFTQGKSKASFYQALVQSIHTFSIDQSKIESLMQESESGDVSLDQFVERKFIIHSQSASKIENMTADCKDIWQKDLKYTVMSIHTSFEDQFISAQANGFLDQIRKDWVFDHQLTYCQKHPKDQYSCREYTSGDQEESITSDETILVSQTARWLSLFLKYTLYSDEFRNKLEKLLPKTKNRIFQLSYRQLKMASELNSKFKTVRSDL